MAWSIGSDVELVESDDSDEESLAPVGNAFPFTTVSRTPGPVPGGGVCSAGDKGGGRAGARGVAKK